MTEESTEEPPKKHRSRPTKPKVEKPPKPPKPPKIPKKLGRPQKKFKEKNQKTRSQEGDQ